MEFSLIGQLTLCLFLCALLNTTNAYSQVNVLPPQPAETPSGRQSPAQEPPRTTRSTPITQQAPNQNRTLSDKVLEAKVFEELATSYPNLRIQTSTANGVVTLSGSVPDSKIDKDVVQLINAISGVQSVDLLTITNSRKTSKQTPEAPPQGENAAAVTQAFSSAEVPGQKPRSTKTRLSSETTTLPPVGTIATSSTGAATIGVCPLTDELASISHSDTLVVPRYITRRALIANDYIVIEYAANADRSSWSDYKKSIFDTSTLRQRTFLVPEIAKDSFLPIFYSKEKIAVRICGLRFTDVASVKTVVNGVPEGVADIRGVAAVTPPASLSSTFDTLQIGVPTGGTTLLPGLGLGAPSQVPSLAVTGITPGAMGAEDQTPGKFASYTPANATASGKQVALLLFGMVKNAIEEASLIERTTGKAYPTSPATLSVDAQRYLISLKKLGTYTTQSAEVLMEGAGSAPGSVKGVKYSLALALGQVRLDDASLTDSVAFDRDLIDVQNVNAQITTLASSLSSQAFASNALTLLNNYSALIGTLDLAELGLEQKNCHAFPPKFQAIDIPEISTNDLKGLTLSDFAAWSASQLMSLTPKQIDAMTDKATKAQLPHIQKALSAAGITSATPGNDRPLCSAFEQKKLQDFQDQYEAQVKTLIDGGALADLQCTLSGTLITPDSANTFNEFAGCELFNLNAKFDELRKSLRDIDQDATELYTSMNNWNENSRIEHTDTLPPLPQNADVRISIAVQRGFTPFTLVTANGSITPAVSANIVSSTPTTASSSAPAHATKIFHVQVHRLANFNLVGGALLIHIPTATYGVQPSPTYAKPDPSSPTSYSGTCAGATVPVPVSSNPSSPVSYSCVVETQKTEWQVAGMAGVTWFPIGHDYYPHKLGYLNTGRNLIPSFLLATSVTSLGNAMGGMNWEPIGGIDLYTGIASGHKTVLPSGLSVGTAVVPGATVTSLTQEHAGFAIGIGLDLNSITALFAFKGTSAGVP